MKEAILILLIMMCTASAINSTVKMQVRRVSSARVTPRPMRLREWSGVSK